MQKIPMVIDTDIGDNIDDAFAVALAANSPEVELLGVTTTFYFAVERALLARRLLAAYGRTDVQVAVGDNPRYDRPPGEARSFFTQASEVQNQGMMSPAAGLPASQWLASLLADHPGTTIVTVAPLTNIAELLLSYPRTTHNIGRIIMMGGWASQSLPEWNIQHDPEAAAVVLESGLPITMVGYEVTLNCALTDDYLEELSLSRDPGPRFLRTLFTRWRQYTREHVPIMHDPLAVALAFAPELVTTAKSRLAVQTSFGPGCGSVFEDWANGHLVDICTSVDRSRYLALLMGRVMGLSTRLDDMESTVDFQDMGIHVASALEVNYHPQWKSHSTLAHKHILMFVNKGTGVLASHDAAWNLMTGSTVYISKDTSYSMETESGMTLLIVTFDIVRMNTTRTLTPQDRIRGLTTGIVSVADTYRTANIMRRIISEWNSINFERCLIAQSLFLELMVSVLLSNRSSDGGPSLFCSKEILLAKNILDATVEGSISLGDLSKRVGLSPYHLTRRFRDTYGMPAMEYYRRRKMSRACALLKLGHLSVGEIANRLGFKSVQSFSRAFTRQVGVNPQEYKRKR